MESVHMIICGMISWIILNDKKERRIKKMDFGKYIKKVRNIEMNKKQIKKSIRVPYEAECTDV